MYISPHEYLYDDAERWNPFDSSDDAGRLDSEESLEDARQSCRQLALTNEFAICGHENRISYVVGTGHQISVEAAPGSEISPRNLACAQNWIDEFVLENDWFSRQQEILRRKDRDGEAFLRFFVDQDGQTRVRFIEPEDVFTPKDLRPETGSPSRNPVRFGVQTAPGDAESVQGFWVNGQFVPAREVQHRKANVDAAVPRGIPVFYPVRKNLHRAEKLLRNMSVVAEVQSAIAIIRKHQTGSRLGIENYAASGADLQTRNYGSFSAQRSNFYRQYTPGTILDTSAGVEYQFPVAAVDASRYILVLQAELRAIASRLCMPEFMLTSDASNANYSSTMVAEGPSVRMFERLQREMIREDSRLMKRVLLNGVSAGKLPDEILTGVRIHIVPPKLSVRDRLEEVKADQILVELGAMTVDELRTRYSTVQKTT
ncbi:MAG: phage portal protein [Thermoguttaceae bacterium]|nr:phage portal protein [Thermoguttaceae bacterium]